MMLNVHRSLLTRLGVLMLFCVTLPDFLYALENETEWYCPGTQLTDVQPVFPPCSDVATSVTFVVSSVDPVISYSISGGTPQSNPVFSNIPSGNYTLDLIVAPNCAVSFPFTISNPNLPFFAEVSQRDVSCTGNNGIIDFEVAGGIQPYNYFIQYSNNAIYPLAVDSLGGFTPGTYTIIAEDANGCQIDTTISLLSYSFPMISQTIITPSDCNGSNGTIEIILGNPPVGVYTISYSINGGASYQSSNVFNNLPPGQYIVYAAVNGCLSNMGIPTIVTVPDLSGIVISNVTTTPTNCSGNTGTISITAAAASGPLLYSINGGQTYSSNPVFNNLAAGNYNVVVLNSATGCDETQTVSITTSPSPVITGIPFTPSACNVANGQLTIQATSATPGNLVYSINNGQNFSSNPTFTAVAPGTYSVVVQNQLTGCVQTATFVMPSFAGPIINSIQTTDANCVLDNGTISIQAQGAPGSLLYSINGGQTYGNSTNYVNLPEGTYTISVQNSATGCVTNATAIVGAIGAPQIISLNLINPTCTSDFGQVTVQASTPGAGSLQYSLDGGSTTQTSPLFQDLIAGNYTVTVIDPQNCSVSSPFSLLAPEVPAFTSVNVLDASCVGNDGIVEFSVAGGSQPYDYSVEYNGAGIYPIFDDSIGGFSAGTYQFIVEDADGCQTDTTITILSYEFPMISVVNTVSPDCNASDGSIEIVISNPPPTAGSYITQYSINGGINYQSSNEFNNLAPGQYFIYVSVDGCLSNMGFPVEINLEENYSVPDLDIALLSTDCNTNNGAITFSSSANSALIYSIDGGANYSSSTDFPDLSAGTYELSIQNPVDGCQFDTTVVLETVDGPVISDILITEADCGINNGQIDVLATDPNGSELTYSIDGGLNTQSGGTFNDLDSGNYTVTVSNEAGCNTAVFASIQDNSIPDVFAGADQEVCAGNSTILIANATVGSSISWNNNVTNNVSFVPTFTNNYIVMATAQNGCSATDTLLLTVNEPILPTITVTSEGNCFPIDVYLSQNNSDYSNCNWVLSNGLTSTTCGEFVVNLEESGCYDVLFTATDINGCSVSVTESDVVCLEAGPVANFNYSPATITTEDESIQLVNTSENAVNYSWELLNDQTSNAENPVINDQLLPGSYPVQLIAFDANGCADTIVKIITVETEFSVFVPNSFTPDGDEFNQVFLPVLSPGYDPSDYSFIIFNRWGQIVFESLNPAVGWDGTYKGRMVPQGVYTYRLLTKSLLNAESFEFTGHVSVLR